MTPEEIPVQISRLPAQGLNLEVAETGPAEGPLVILLHGFPDLWQGWHFQIEPLTTAGFRLLLPNLRGYGESDKPRGIAAYDLDRLAEDIVALADSQGRDKFHLVGHDWGGIVAWWVAARFPDRVERLAVLAAPHPGIFKTYLLRHPMQILRSWYIGSFQIPWLPETILRAKNYALLKKAVESTSLPGTFDESDWRYLIAGWSQPGALTGMLNYYRAITRRREASLRLPIPMPTLILFGRHDPAEEPGLAQASKAMCDEARVVELEEARHWIQREEAERVNEELLLFLSKVRDG